MLQEANRRLDALSMTDPRTGISNRRHLDAPLPRIVAEARRDKVPLTIPEPNQDPSILVEKAYKAIYKAKAEGRTATGSLITISVLSLPCIFQPRLYRGLFRVLEHQE